MQKNIIHFSHANGFPAETYRKLFHFLKNDFEIGYISVHGHNPDYPVTENWPQLVKELIDYIKGHYQQPVIGVGHSLGGVLTFMAAINQPELFKSIVLLDAPIPSYLRSKLVLLAKWLGFVDKITPAHRAKQRRIQWQTSEEALQYFQNRALFKHFDPDCLRDYVEYGTLKTSEGIRLRFNRDVEYRIFRTLPHILPKFRQQLKVSGTLIYGKESTVVTVADIAHMQKYFHMQCIPIAGGHLFPFEHPELTAQTLKTVIS